MQIKFDEIPVSKRLNETVETSLEQIKREQRRKKRKKLWIGCGSAAAAFAVTVLFCVSNPALAAKLPVIGSLFAGLEDDFAFTGDYSDRAEVLTPPETVVEAPASESESERAVDHAESNAAETAETPEGLYTVSDRGITLTASEIYCDGLSVFLSMQFYSEEPLGYNYQWNSDGEIVRDEAGNPITEPATVYLVGSAGIDGMEVTEFGSTDFHVEQLDEHHFNGMIKTDLPSELLGKAGSHQISISLSRILADFCDENGHPIIDSNNPEDISYCARGTWELELPFHSDTSQLQVYENLDPSESPCRVTDVYVSPYQIMTRYVGVEDGPGDPDGGVTVFDQDGKLLESANSIQTYGISSHSLNGSRPSSVQIYVIDAWITAMKTWDTETAKDRAVNTYTLELHW